MNNEIPRIDNLTGRSNGEIRINFESLIHCFPHYFDISLYTSTKKQIITERLIFSWTAFHKKINFID